MPKKALFYVLLLGALYLCMEVLSYGMYWIAKGERFSFTRIRAQQVEVAGYEKLKVGDSTFRKEDGIGFRVVHPYVGFVLDPVGPIRNISVDPIQPLTSDQCVINAHGFTGDPAFLKKQDGVVNIIITGGSVSSQFYCLARDRLISALKQSGRYKNKTIRIVGLGVPAHHAPQQLMAVNYYLAHGGEFDILINIDGFNEMFVPGVMAQNHMYPSYPLFWNQFLSPFTSEKIKLVGSIMFYQDLRQSLASGFSYVDFSVTASSLWSLVDGAITTKIQRARVALNAADESDDLKSFHWAGPREPVENIETFSKGLWFRSSLQLARIARANGASYFHFLQPNIHVRNSKPLSEKERNIIDHLPVFIPPETTDMITRAYPILTKHGQGIAVAGGYFYALTSLFQNEKRTVYIDAGGHLTPLGNNLMADFIGQQISRAGAP
jgi:hypothetical protein